MIWMLVLRGFPVLERIMPIRLPIPAILNRIFPTLAAFIIFFIIYRWLPATRVPWRSAFWGALAASLAWTALNLGYSWFLQSGFATYDSLYGSLGTSIALLTWVYISAMIILAGAHLSSSIAAAKRPLNSTPDETTADLTVKG
jgi:membrane protein